MDSENPDFERRRVMKPYSESKLCKDIIMICKGRYDNDKYPTLLSAFEAYYHKHYSGCDDIQMTCVFANYLFLYPAVLSFINDENIHVCLQNIVLEQTSAERLNNITDFQEVLFERLSTWIMLQPVKMLNDDGDWDWIIDLSMYGDDDIDI